MRETKGVYRDWRWNNGIRGRIFQKQPDDYWQCEWYTGRGKRKRQSTYTKDEAEAWQRLAEYQSDRGVRALRYEPFTLAEAAVFAGRRQRSRNNSEQWRERCAKIIEQHLFRIIGPDFDLNNGDIADEVERYVEQRRKELAPSGKPISYATIRKELLIIYQGCRKGRDHGKFKGAVALVLPENIDDLIAKERAAKKIGHALTLDQYRALLEVATEHRRPWIVFGVNTGIDLGPTHRIRKDAILWDVGPYGAVHVLDTKTPDRNRIVPLNADARWAVDQRMDEPGELLFEPVWSSRAFALCMERWCPKAKIPKRLRWKDLRHSFASILGNVGAPQNHVGALMGHASDSQIVEKVYQHLDPEALAQTVTTMPSIVFAKSSSTPTGDPQQLQGKADAALGVNLAKTAQFAG